MQVITTIETMQKTALSLRAEGKTIGFVPTMGYLHEGHQALLKRARQENDIVILSVFVNPLQFGPNEDFDTYPRDKERDEQVARNANVDYVFYPSVNEMYPEPLSTSITVTARTNVLCGRKRPGHFDGVATVLIKLFHITMPHNAYFGLKDAQQVAVIRGFVADYNIPVTINPVDIVREEDGLAKSSRNTFLSSEERKDAPHLNKSLQLAKKAIDEGERSPQAIISLISKYLQDHTQGEIDYVELYAYPSLTEVETIQGSMLIAIAVKFPHARLIDNITFTI
ncbi:pantoate--beta-alanine ligase [Ectobacillus sp. sgz5001026]|uniref:pantoate--beta-alanine ligase n=1 Tax=Ectobacillus sp. sgz5001026 TaxID=3242473 RepID=UPI0036D39852